jgi:hypothetical protein
MRYHLQFSTQDDPIDEIQDYWNARYLSTGEGAWRMMGYPVTVKRPAVTPLPIHLGQSIVFDGKSLLKHYFARPLGHYTHHGSLHSFDTITYKEYFTVFHIASYDPAQNEKDHYFLENTTFHPMHVILRRGSQPHFTRLHHVRPSAGEWFYLRSLLQFKPAWSFDDLLTVDGILHFNFQSAARAHGMFMTTDSESTYALTEAISSPYTPPQLRILFIHLLVNDCIESPIALWEKFHSNLSFDFAIQHSQNPNSALQSSLQHLSSLLQEYGKMLSDFGLQEPAYVSTE